MSMRIRVIGGRTIALCAVESDPKPGDVYLDDAAHQAITEKYLREWAGRTLPLCSPDPVVDAERVCDAAAEHERWQREQTRQGVLRLPCGCVAGDPPCSKCALPVAEGGAGR